MQVDRVQFESPRSFVSLLLPFVPVRDSRGRRFHVGGLVGLYSAIRSARRQKPVSVAFFRESRGVFRIVRWLGV